MRQAEQPARHVAGALATCPYFAHAHHPLCAEKVLTIKHYSLTIPDDPHMHQLLLRLLAAVRAELQQPDGGLGDACRPGTATADAGSVEAARATAQVQHSCRGGGASTSEVAGAGASGAGYGRGF